MFTHSGILQQFFSLIFSTLLITTLSAKAASLDINARPEGLSAAITKKYEALVSEGLQSWSYNGAEKYLMARVDDDAMVKKIVGTYAQQKIFNLLDVGAGDHSWAKARVKYLNAEFSDREIHFNIFSLTGDNYKEEGYEERAGINIVEEKSGICSLYKLSAFPIENLIAKLEELGYLDMLSSQTDLIVSAYTLMHLVDPIGTFLQMYNLARPNQGLLFVESFFRMGNHDYAPVKDFLTQTQLEFFMPYGPNSFVVRRAGEEGKFPYNYQIKEHEGEHLRATLVNIGPGKEDIQKNPKNTLKGRWNDTGSESLRDWLPLKE